MNNRQRSRIWGRRYHSLRWLAEVGASKGYRPRRVWERWYWIWSDANNLYSFARPFGLDVPGVSPGRNLRRNHGGRFL